MYLRVTIIIDVEKIGYRRVLIYSTDFLKGKRSTCVTRVCSLADLILKTRVARVVA